MNRPSKWIVIASLFAGLGTCMLVALFLFDVVKEKPRFVDATMQQIKSWSAWLEPASLVAPNDPLEFDVNLIDIANEHGITLAGFPSYATFDIPLPRDSEFQELAFNLVGEKDVAPNAVVALRVAVNGQRIMDRLLSPGTGTVQYKFIVTGDMRRADRLVVSLQLHGDIADHVCHNERSSGAVFTALPQTGLVGRLERPIGSIRDVAAALPRKLDIALPQDPQNKALIELAFKTGLRLAQSGHDITFTQLAALPKAAFRGHTAILFGTPAQLRGAGFTSTPNKAVTTNIDAQDTAKAAAPISVWYKNGAAYLAITGYDHPAIQYFLASKIVPLAARPHITPHIVNLRPHLADQPEEVSFASLGVNTAIAKISDKKNWRIGYKLADMPNGRAPIAASVALQLPSGPDDITYSLHAELNGTMLRSTKLTAAALNQVTIPLPAKAHALHNSLDLTVQRQVHDGGCLVAIQKYPVQLLDSSALQFASRGIALPTGLVDMPRKLNAGVDIRLPAQEFSTRPVAALNSLVPLMASLLPFDVDPHLLWLGADRLADEVPDKPFVALWHVPPGTDNHVTQSNRQLITAFKNWPVLDLAPVANMITVEAVTARHPIVRRTDRVHRTDGVIIQSTGTPPSTAGVSVGQVDSIIVFDDNLAMPLARSPIVGRDVRPYTSPDHE